MRARISMNTLLRNVEHMRAMVQEEDGPVQRRGMLKVPPILSMDEWERIAMRQQAELAAAAREDIDPMKETEHEAHRSRTRAAPTR